MLNEELPGKGSLCRTEDEFTPQTAVTRDLLFDFFCRWVDERGLDHRHLIFSSRPDLDLLNAKLVEYGRQLFHDGKPFYHLSETLNALTVARPAIRRCLQRLGPSFHLGVL